MLVALSMVKNETKCDKVIRFLESEGNRILGVIQNYLSCL